MKKLFKSKRGAVTVLVTLLLVPAILISGTGVDIARIYMARSILQDANQLALNSVLADYNGLLQDLYGLFGVTLDDSKLNSSAKKYIEKALFATDSDTKGNNVLRLFYGTEPSFELCVGEDQNLGSRDKLRRQIEEYSKIRAPIILAEELVDRLKEFNKVDDDAEIIKDKIAIEDKIEDIDEYYKKIYETINNLNGYDEDEEKVTDLINGYLYNIREMFLKMPDVRTSYESAYGKKDNNGMKRSKAYYNGLRDNIKSFISGGTIGEKWNNDKQKWDETLSIDSITKIAENCAKPLDEYISKSQGLFSDKTETLENLKEHCKKADEAKRELKTMINNLRTKLETSECHDELKSSLGDEGGLLDEYEKLVEFDLTKLSSDMYDHDSAYIQRFTARLKAFENESCYATTEDTPLKYYKIGDVKNAVNTMGIDFNINADNSEDDKVDLLSYFGDEDKSSPVPFEPAGEYLTWIECTDAFNNPDYEEFFKVLSDLYDGEAGTKKSEAENSVLTVLSSIQDLFKIGVEPEGAWHLANSTKSGDEADTDFGNDSDWSKKGAAKKDLNKSLDSDVISRLGNILDSLTNKALLLVYSSEMFSCYTTESGDKNMAGAPMSVDVNYFFQSELEYIYHGDMTNAINNHNAVGSLIFLIRFIMNYTTSFSISSVNNLVNEIKTALGWLGPVSIAIGELARLALAAAESLVDLNLLRQGYKVALLKNDETWKFQLGKIMNVSVDAVKSTATGSSGSSNAFEDKNGLLYIDYLRIFLLFVNGDTMADRVGDLIELNMTNKKNDIGSKTSREAREQAMAEVERFDLGSAKTGFVITTTAQINMLFLSMPLAQKSIEGIVPPKTMDISAVSYRGY